MLSMQVPEMLAEGNAEGGGATRPGTRWQTEIQVRDTSTPSKCSVYVL